MLAILHLLGTFVVNLFRSRRRLEVENLFLRHQLNIALRRAQHRLQLHGCDRALVVWMTRAWPSLLGLSRVVQPDTAAMIPIVMADEQIDGCQMVLELLAKSVRQPRKPTLAHAQREVLPFNKTGANADV